MEPLKFCLPPAQLLREEASPLLGSEGPDAGSDAAALSAGKSCGSNSDLLGNLRSTLWWHEHWYDEWHEEPHEQWREAGPGQDLLPEEGPFAAAAFDNPDWRRLAPVLRQLEGRRICDFDQRANNHSGAARAVSLALNAAYTLPFNDHDLSGLEETIRRFGWASIEISAIRPGDIVIGKGRCGRQVCAAIFIGQDRIFHHNPNAERMQIDCMKRFRRPGPQSIFQDFCITAYRKMA